MNGLEPQAKLEQQCRFWLKPTGCRDPLSCTLGEHNPEHRGKGSPVLDPKGKGKGKGDKGKGDKGGKGKGKDKKGDERPHGVDAGGAETTKRPRDATTNAEGKYPCFKLPLKF